MEYITISIKLGNSEGKEIIGTIVIRDGFALTTFTDPNLAKQVYEHDLEKGENVSFNEKHNAYIKNYKGKKKEIIIEELKKEIKESGAEILE